MSSKRWVRPWDLSTSGESRFVQKGYSKKSKDHNRENWRKRKGFIRDQAKIQGHRMDGCPPWLKRQCNQDYRAWVQNLIKNERFDEICWRKDFYDPWMWD